MKVLYLFMILYHIGAVIIERKGRPSLQYINLLDFPKYLPWGTPDCLVVGSPVLSLCRWDLGSEDIRRRELSGPHRTESGPRCNREYVRWEAEDNNRLCWTLYSQKWRSIGCHRYIIYIKIMLRLVFLFYNSETVQRLIII